MIALLDIFPRMLKSRFAARRRVYWLGARVIGYRLRALGMPGKRGLIGTLQLGKAGDIGSLIYFF
jgi:hypothetical protein